MCKIARVFMVWKKQWGSGWGSGAGGGGGVGGAKTQDGGPELTKLTCSGWNPQRIFSLSVTLMNDYT